MAEWNEDDSNLNQDFNTEEPQDNDVSVTQENNENIVEESELSARQRYYREADFYGNQQIYNSRLDDYEKDMNADYLSQEERDYAKQQYDEVYIEKRDAIDQWKEKYGQYDEARTNLRIGEEKLEENEVQENNDVSDQNLENYAPQDDNDAPNPNSEEIEEQETNDVSAPKLEDDTQQTQTSDAEIVEQGEVNYDNLSDEELAAKYNEVTSRNQILGEQYGKYGEQIAEIGGNKKYYRNEQDWNSHMDEKINAQNDVVSRRYQVQREMRAMEAEMNKRRK